MRRVMVMILVVSTCVIIILLLSYLSLCVLLVLHPPVLEPDLDLSLREVQVPRELPPLLLGDVRVEEELLLQLEGLELGVRLAFLADGHLASPLQRVGAGPTRHPNTYAHAREGTCGEERRWGGTPHHFEQLVIRW